MSSFNCPKCNLPQIDTKFGYATGCQHYNPDWRAVNQTHEKLQKAIKLLERIQSYYGDLPHSFNILIDHLKEE